MNDPMTVYAAQQMASEAGVKLTPADYRAMAELARAVQQSPLEATESRFSGFIAAFNEYYPAFLRSLVGLSEVLITAAQTVIVSFGVPIVLILLLIVEHSRVKHGIALFETSPSLASFAAWALVILNTVLEFTIHHVEASSGYQHRRAMRGSLRLHFGRLAYWLGLSRNWRPEALSPAYRYRQLLRLVTFTILALAVAGSMRVVIEGQQGRWYDALQAVVTESTLSEMTTWAGGLLFALAAVMAAQGLTAYLALKVAEITTRLDAAPAPTITAEAAQVQYILAKIAKAQGQQIGQAAEPENPFLLPVMTTPNGNGRH